MSERVSSVFESRYRRDRLKAVRVVVACRVATVSRRGERCLLVVGLAIRRGVDVPCGDVNNPGVL